jgi:hypothetical protein
MNSTYAFLRTRQRIFIVATGMVAILTGVAFGQTQIWIGGSGNWGDPTN